MHYGLAAVTLSKETLSLDSAVLFMLSRTHYVECLATAPSHTRVQLISIYFVSVAQPQGASAVGASGGGIVPLQTTGFRGTNANLDRGKGRLGGCTFPPIPPPPLRSLSLLKIVLIVLQYVA